MFLQRSRGVFILRLFWRSGLRPRGFLRKQGFWKSAVHQLLLNHLVGSRAGAAGPEWCSTLSRVQRQSGLGQAMGGSLGRRAECLGRRSPPAHTVCFSALALWSGTAGEEREQPFSASVQKKFLQEAFWLGIAQARG